MRHSDDLMSEIESDFVPRQIRTYSQEMCQPPSLTLPHHYHHVTVGSINLRTAFHVQDKFLELDPPEFFPGDDPNSEHENVFLQSRTDHKLRRARTRIILACPYGPPNSRRERSPRYDWNMVKLERSVRSSRPGEVVLDQGGIRLPVSLASRRSGSTGD